MPRKKKISKEVIDQLEEIGIDMLDHYKEYSDHSKFCLYCKDLNRSAFPIPDVPWVKHCVICGNAFVEH